VPGSPETSKGELTDPAFIQRLESLALLARRVLAGKLQADRVSRTKGSGVTFADHAAYAPGDDHRAIDWRVYAKLEHLVVKLFEVEEDMSLIVLLDASRSMNQKLPLATRLAAALAYIALAGLDRVTVYTFTDRPEQLVEPLHGRARALTALRRLETVTAGDGASDFAACCRQVAARQRRRAMIVPISDFLFQTGYDEGLSRLRHQNHDVFCIQILGDADRRCDLRGDVELRCVESGAGRNITITPALAARYESAVREWNEQLHAACARRGIGLVSLDEQERFDNVVQRILRQGGLVA